MAFNYQKICSELLAGLPDRTREVLVRRFGLGGGQKETLDSIGKGYEITRERVRQIENEGVKKIRQKRKEILSPVYQYFSQEIRKSGGLKNEDILLSALPDDLSKNQVFFILNLSDKFKRVSASEKFHAFWAVDPKSFDSAKKLINCFSQDLIQKNQALRLEEFASAQKIDAKLAGSFLGISKEIMVNSEGLYGLSFWPEINPKRIRDKAYIVFKKMKKPLHFSAVANMINGSNVQTVHNELIRDQRFILVGRGLYALKEWGYTPGQAKDVILKVLKESGRPLTKGEILEKVLGQRLIKENTVLLNLSNKKYFLRDTQGKYWVKES